MSFKLKMHELNPSNDRVMFIQSNSYDCSYL